MESEDLDSLIDVKKSKMSKISAKLSSTKDKIKTNEGNLKTQKKELEDLQTNKVACQESLLRTNDFLEIVDGLEEDLTSRLLVVLEKDYEIEKDEEEEDISKLEEEVKNGGYDSYKDPVVNSVPHFSEVNYNPPTVTFTGDNRGETSTSENNNSNEGEIPNITLNITAPPVANNVSPTSPVSTGSNENEVEEPNLDFDLGDDLDLTTKLDLDSITIDDDNKNTVEPEVELPVEDSVESEIPVPNIPAPPEVSEPTIAETIPAPAEDAFIEEQLNSLEPETSKVDVLPMHEEKDYEENRQTTSLTHGK